jgi:PPOX class probable F420-dependent enzyme
MSSDIRVGLFTQRNRGVLVTLKRDGRPQLSNVAFSFEQETQVIRISVTNDRAKTRNLRRDPRASFYVGTEDMGGYLVAEGDAELSAVAQDPNDATVDELVSIYRSVAGDHPAWPEFRTAMVDEARLVIRLPIGRTYGWSR